MKQKIRWGVIGSSGIALRRTIPEGIIPASNAELTSVYCRNHSENEKLAKQFNARPAQSIEELLNGIDAVYIATPPHVHLEQTRQAAAAGVHVFCEKPPALNVDEARQMLDICRQAKVNLGTAFMMRFNSQHQAMLRLVREGKIGQPVYARAQLSCWYPPAPGAWRQQLATGGGGALMDLAGHCLDLLEMFFGPAKSVSCMTNHTVHQYESEDSGIIAVRFENGALATVDTFFCIQDYSSRNRLEIYGSQGSLLAGGTIGQGKEGQVLFLSGEKGTELKPPVVNTYQAEIEDFSQAVLDGRDTNASAQAGLRSQIILAACYESARTGREIQLAG